MNALPSQCRWEDPAVRKRTDHPSLWVQDWSCIRIATPLIPLSVELLSVNPNLLPGLHKRQRVSVVSFGRWNTLIIKMTFRLHGSRSKLCFWSYKHSANDSISQLLYHKAGCTKPPSSLRDPSLTNADSMVPSCFKIKSSTLLKNRAS